MVTRSTKKKSQAVDSTKASGRVLPQPIVIPVRDAAAQLRCSVALLCEVAAAGNVDFYVDPPDLTGWVGPDDAASRPYCDATGLALLSVPNDRRWLREIGKDRGPVPVPDDLEWPLILYQPDKVYFGTPPAGWAVSVDDLYMLRADVEGYDLASPDDAEAPHPTKWRSTLRATDRIIAGLVAMVRSDASGADGPPAVAELARRVCELVPTEDRDAKSIAKVIGEAMKRDRETGDR